jgi:hypothetical protein
MAKTIIYQPAYLLEVSINDEQLDDDDLGKKIDYLDKPLITEKGEMFKWISASVGIYDTTVDNIGKCAKCGAWATDCEADNCVSGVSNGAKIDGILYCDICLPKDHRWAF